VPSVAIVRLVGCQIPIHANRQLRLAELAKQSELPEITNIARITVLHLNFTRFSEILANSSQRIGPYPVVVLETSFIIAYEECGINL
jgi:hypothetical protein